MAMLAELDVHAGDLDAAAGTATEADRLAVVTGISYKRALAQRAHALSDAAAGDDAAAIDGLRSSRWPHAPHEWSGVRVSLARGVGARVARVRLGSVATPGGEPLGLHLQTSGSNGDGRFAARANELLALVGNR